MVESTRFRVNTPSITHQTIEGEVVIINLETGNYYSVTQVGVDVWNLLDAGHAIDDVVAQVAATYDGGSSEIEASVLQFLGELRKEDLVVPRDGSAPPVTAPTAGGVPAGNKRPFEPPSVQRYTDMQDLLLLDPIHEVDDTGWPNLKPGVLPKSFG